MTLFEPPTPQTDFVFEIELPPSKLSPNGSQGNWRARSTAKSYHRESCAAAVAKALPKDWQPCPIRIHTEWFMALMPLEIASRKARAAGQKRVIGINKAEVLRYRPNDAQNAISSLKAAVDGMVDGGLVPADSHRWVQWGTVVLHRSAKEHRGRAGIVVRVERLEER